MILALSPDREWELFAAMSQAWEWAQRRFYCDNGYGMEFGEYLQQARQPDRKQIGVLNEGHFIAVITVHLKFEGVYEIHVTAKRHANAALILWALQRVRDGLFQNLNASEIWTSCGIYNGHENKGVRRLAEACGMRPSGVEWQSETNPRITWREYVITKEQYYGRKEKHDN